jgi:hypothetical protein
MKVFVYDFSKEKFVEVKKGEKKSFLSLIVNLLQDTIKKKEENK